MGYRSQVAMLIIGERDDIAQLQTEFVLKWGSETYPEGGKLELGFIKFNPDARRPNIYVQAAMWLFHRAEEMSEETGRNVAGTFKRVGEELGDIEEDEFGQENTNADDLYDYVSICTTLDFSAPQ